LVILFGVVPAMAGSIHYYLWWRLVRSTARPGMVRAIGAWVIAGTVLLLLGTLVLTRLDPALDWLATIGFLWLAVMFYLLVTLVVLEVPALVAKRVRRATAPDAGGLRAGALLQAGTRSTVAAPDGGGAGRTPPEPAVDETRRLFVSRAVAITAGLVAVGTTGYGVSQALGKPLVKRRQITLAKLLRAMDGYRVALVSDIHLGPLAGKAHTQRIVDIVNSLDADIVSVVGDLVDGTVAQLGGDAQPLRQLRSRHGAYFVTGNHEYYSGYQEWIEEVTELGLKPLRNQRIELPGGLDLAGVNDATGGDFGDAPDYAKALGDRDPAKPVILLAHQPVQVAEAAKYGVDLQLSGHTHGGQMAPFNLAVRLQQPVVSGYDVIDGTQVYVTNGAGFWGPPVRVGAPPDVTLIELRSA
jgi:predicted MPP superfamily phosphohydrolase